MGIAVSGSAGVRSVGKDEPRKPYKYDCLDSENVKPVTEIELKLLLDVPYVMGILCEPLLLDVLSMMGILCEPLLLDVPYVMGILCEPLLLEVLSMMGILCEPLLLDVWAAEVFQLRCVPVPWLPGRSRLGPLPLFCRGSGARNVPVLPVLGSKPRKAKCPPLTWFGFQALEV
ncbi:hypothetical protein DUI87_15086 [Hirundo rustica rustica]|uniref:Uncharacterized protein n=1 Tax=Hirundo rustica rustica TaxID=333673 RepID=A0A3M0K6U0_HIRRU|nr:hypothetical protein DUI87_15086 [Hirundo rustica rustica]